MSRFAPKTRVVYTGSADPSLRGQHGTVLRSRRNDYLRVQFDDARKPVKCSEYSLSATLDDGTPVPPRQHKRRQPT